MSIVEAAATELRRLAESARDSFSGHPDDAALSRYVSGLMVPPLQDALRDISARNVPSHRIEGPGERGLGEPPITHMSVVHYTSAQTAFALLHGALSEEPGASLRLYDSEHTNDPKEGSYFFQALDLPPQHHWASAATPSHAYLTSFLIPRVAEDLSDDLTFWRTYGRDGQGCSLQVWVPAELLRRVCYGPVVVPELRADLLTLLDAVAPIAKLSEDVKSVLRGALWEELVSLRYLYKNDAYSGERECRIVVPRKEADETSVQFDYRYDSGSLRRYLEYPELMATKLFGQSGASVTIGPAAPDKEELHYSFNLMRRRVGLSDYLTIKTSRISYRSAS